MERSLVMALALTLCTTFANADDWDDCAQLGDEFDLAIRSCTRIIEHPNRVGWLELVDAYFSRGLAYEAKGERQRAIDDYSQLIELDPDEADHYDSRGSVYLEVHEFDGAIADYTKAIELDPSDSEYHEDGGYHYNRGVAYRGKGDIDRAVVDFKKALSLNPDMTKAREALNELQ